MRIHIYLAGICVSLLFLLSGNTAEAQIVNIEDRRGSISDTTGIFGRFDAGFYLTENSATVISLRGNLQAELLKKRNDWLLFLNYSRLQTNNSRILDDGYAHLRYNRILRERLVWEVFGQAQYNERIQIFFRGLLGTGPRFLVFDDENYAVYAGMAYMFDYEQIADPSIIYRDHRLSSYVSFNLKPSKVVNFAGTFYYQPIITNFSSSRLSGQSSLVLHITRRFSVGVNVSVSHNPRLQEAVLELPATTYSLSNTLRISF